MLKESTQQEWVLARHNKPAGLIVRILALLIDSIVFIPIVLIFFAINLFFQLDIPIEITQILFILYVTIYHWKRGATIGKQQTEIRVETPKGERISLKSSIIRSSFLIIYIATKWIISFMETLSIESSIHSQDRINISVNTSTISSIFLLNLFVVGLIILDSFWVLTNKDKRTLHDVLAGTYCKVK